MEGSNSKQQVWENGDSNSESTYWERPGGMLVQRREDEVDSAVPLIKIKVHHHSKQHDVTVPAQSTFGDLKRVLVQVTGVAPEEQRLLFRGREKNDLEYLHNAGVKDMSRVALLEDPAIRERRMEQIQRDQRIARACVAVAGVRHEVNKLVEKVNALQSSVQRGTQVADQEFVGLTELLMRQLLKLDGIEAEGEARVQRRSEVCRIQQYVEKLDALKVAPPPRNPTPDSNSSNGTSINTQWQTFGSGRGEDDSSVMREIATSSRVRPRDPSPYQPEVLSSACRRRRLHQMDPPSSSHHLLTPDELPSGSRLSLGVSKDFSEEMPSASVVKVSSPDIMTPQVNMALPSNPSATAPTALNPPSIAYNRPAVPNSSFPNAPLNHPKTQPTSVPKGVVYQSEIHYRHPSSPDQRNRDLHNNNLMFLQDLISSLTPESPESLNRFTSYANAALDLLARTGLNEDTFRYWETLCRRVEFLIRQMKSLSVVQTKASLSELQERVKVHQEAADLARGEFEKSSEAMGEHQQRFIDVGCEMDGVTVRLRGIWGEFMSLLSRRADLQLVQEREARAMKEEESGYQIKRGAVVDADAALARAVSEKQAIEGEYQTLAAINAQLRGLYYWFV